MQLLVIVVLLLLTVYESASQICSQSYATYQTVYSSGIQYYSQNYETSCGWWGWSDCRYSRQLARSISVSMRRSMLQYRMVCCSGYSGSPPRCEPICSPSCANGGTCTDPNRCRCTAGWTGSYCTNDINECDAGFCQQICTNNQGSFECSCRSGYTADGNICNDINECSNSPGPCTEICTNTEGSYTCSCNDDNFIVAANGSCTDVNECVVTPGRCQQICNNRVDGFFCTCYEGYELVAGTNCTDINECTTPPNPCEQNCTNTVGNFTCSCKGGFELDGDQRSCNDIDECQVSNRGCDHICTNNVGSYECSCRPGYDLGSDEFTCIAQQCQPRLLAPQNGNISCDGDQVTMTRCNFSCDPGYSLVGSMERICQPNNTWNGSDASCDIMLCEELQSPSNGFVVLPCNMEFESVCAVSCEDGYYTDGPSPYTQTCEVDINGIVQWSSAPTCREITPCDPDPCQHNGQCTIIGSDSGFSCDCSLTGYTGVTCNLGVVTVSSYPALTIGARVDLIISAVPDSELVISITSSDTNTIIISPSSVTITNPASSAMFSIEGGMAGLYSVSYTLSGVNADSYVTPSSSLVFVVPETEDENYFESRGLPAGQLAAAGCFMAPQSLQCQSVDQQINMWSTSQWTNSINALRTSGVVHIVNGALSLPVAIAGASITVEQNRLSIERLDIDSPVTSESMGNCTSFIPSLVDLGDFLRFNALATTFLSSTSTLLPTWIRFMVTNNVQIDSTADRAYLAYVVTREELNDIAPCQNILTNENTLHLVVRHDSLLTINVSQFQVTHTPTNVCFSVELCSQSTPFFHIGLPSNSDVLNQLQFMMDLASAGWRMDLDAVTFSTSGDLMPVDIMETYWTGSTYQSVSFLGAHIGLGGSFTREFTGTATSVTVHVLGNVYWRVENLNQVFDVLLRQRWTGAASGSVSIAVMAPVYGSRLYLNFTAPLAYLSIGGMDRSMCPGSADPAGVFVTTNILTFDTDINFITIFPPSGANCQLDPYVHMSGNTLSGVGFQSNCSDLKLGGLLFPELAHHLLIIAGLDNRCSYDEFPMIAGPSVLVESFIQSRVTEYQLNEFLSVMPSDDGNIMRTSFSQETDSFSAITELARINLLGDSLLSPLSINNSLLSFSGNISINSVYSTTVQATASVNESFDSLSVNLAGVVGVELLNIFQTSINTYLQELVESADGRITVSTTGLQRAKDQLNDSKADVEYRNELLTLASMAYEQALQELDTANQIYIDAIENAYNVSEEVLSVLDSVCELSSCEAECTTGLQCVECQIAIEGYSHSFEESTCFIQSVGRVPPLEKDDYCWSEITSMSEIVLGNCFNYNCKLRTEYISIQELVQEECLTPVYVYETEDVGYSCSLAVEGNKFVYNISQICCSPSLCSRMFPEMECVQSNIACRLVREQLSVSDQTRASLDSLSAASKRLSIAEIIVEEKRVLLDIQRTAYTQALATLAVVNASNTALNASQILLEDEVLRGILPLYRQVQQNGGSTDNIIVLRNITFSTTTSVPQSLTVLPLTLVYNTTVNDYNIYTALFDFSSIESSLTQLTQELVRIADSTFVENSRKRREVEVNPNLEFFQQQCNTLVNSMDFVRDIYQSLEQAVNSSGATYSANMVSNGSTVITGINTTALQALNTSINISGLYSQVIVEDDYITFVNLTKSVNNSVSDLVEYVKIATFTNWQSGQELLQNSSSNLAGLTCYGLIDCLTGVSDILQQLVADLPSEFQSTTLISIKQYTSSFVMLGNATDITITAARELATPLYNLLSSENEAMNYWCASPPNITQHPQSSVIATVNSYITLRCNATSHIPVSYYWSKDGSVLDGAHSNTLSMQVNSFNDEGSYVCHARNHISVTESAASNVDIQVAPAISEHPSDKEVYVGNDNGTMLICRATGDPTPGYQWYFRSTSVGEYEALVNETSSVLTIPVPQLTHAGYYYCNASNPQGHVISDQAVLTVLDVTIPLFYVDISLLVEVVECNISNTSGESNDSIICDVSSINATLFTLDIIMTFNELFNTSNILILNNYTVISAYEVELSLQIWSRNVTTSEIILRPIREIAESTIAAKTVIRNAVELLTITLSDETIQFSDGVYTLEPNSTSLRLSNVSESCPVGQYLHSSNIICINCPPGSHGVTGSTCVQCATDMFQYRQGQVMCESCNATQGTDSNGAMQCADVCTPGSYSTTGLSPCTKCPVNTYQPSQRSTQCIDCPLGTIALNGSTSLANCTEVINTTTIGTIVSVSPTNTITTSGGSGGSSSAAPIAAGVVVAVIVIIAIAVAVIIVLVWYKKKTGKFSIHKSDQPNFEVDNDLYGFTGKPDFSTQSINKSAQNTYEENNTPASRMNMSQNPLYNKSSMQDDDTLEVYANVNDDASQVKMGNSEDYAYCKY